MDNFPEPPPLDRTLQLQRDIHLLAVDTLRGMLPSPIEDPFDVRLLRDHAAFASVASLVPANPAEVRIAGNHVAAMEHASACLRQVADFPDDPRQVAKLRAQAASMGREARGYLGALQRMQAIRLKRESNDSTRESAAWTEHCLLGTMTQAFERIVEGQTAGTGPAAGLAPGKAAPLADAPLTRAPPAEAPPADAPLTRAPPAEAPVAEAPVAALAPAAQPAEHMTVAGTPARMPRAAIAPAAPVVPMAPPRAPATASRPRPAARKPVAMDEPPRDVADEVDYYAVVYPSRLRLIRKHGGLPPDCDFGPPDPDLVRAIVASESPLVLAALDERAPAPG